MKKLVSLLLTGALSFGLLAGCGGGNSGSANTPAGNSETPSGNSETPAVENTASLEGTTIKVGATPAPHAEILEIAKGILAEQGITLEIVEFNDYIQPNLAVESGELDANYFQHITYMNEFNVSDGTHLVSAAEIHYEPFGLYAGKTASIDELADGAQIAVPNDTTNEARALLLLQQEGLITLKEGAGITATKADIAENPKNLDIVELEASQLPVRLGDVDMAVINGNYAIDAGLKVSDALAVESADGEAAQAYVNVLAVKEGHENDPAIQALVEALKSDEVKTFMDETYEGAVVPMF
ncbi:MULTISPECIES: MetQ/NlpA family ABC transporter substrate-binding protein [unclassified Flavonifractor]|uniref:MetQ/NlpA family ABC transporter substrate-binding protein n=1 Tax=unclassified Flavonifractor TaxID=2629267 RepID=UPI000B37486D|nr:MULTISPECIES: MetQ/NlpA family ABC transporter substrate-binding protein [unclassified Flavonifractor]OUN11076.1 metal ABC transporter substrate-binding protein [Flavonifractor sp. An91]OUN13533.1 metal ABC transporter substrate-binding protein [Flavonifractor sp. An9]OUO14683.1 metal ABC transporter substrate-binding protein [Flavonifractor sp. An4]